METTELQRQLKIVNELADKAELLRKANNALDTMYIVSDNPKKGRILFGNIFGYDYSLVEIEKLIGTEKFKEIFEMFRDNLKSAVILKREEIKNELSEYVITKTSKNANAEN